MIQSSWLLFWVVVSFIPDFAAALANPIAYQSALEKHSQQLAVLEEDFDAPVSRRPGARENLGSLFVINE